MTLSALGIFSAAGAGGGAVGDYELIETTILGTAASSVTFSSLATYASTYKHLQLRVSGNNSTSGAWSFRFNGDSGNNYSWHLLYGVGTGGALSFASTSQSSGYLGYATAGTNLAPAAVMDILDFASTTKNKTTRSLNGEMNATSPNIILASSAWYSTAAITSLTLLANVNFVASSRFSLYGIR